MPRLAFGRCAALAPIRTELRITSTAAAGIVERRKRVADLQLKLRPKVLPGNNGSVQARELWSTSEEVHLRPGHHWVFEFGDAGDGTSVEKTFNLDARRHEIYKGIRFDDGDEALVRILYPNASSEHLLEADHTKITHDHIILSHSYSIHLHRWSRDGSTDRRTTLQAAPLSSGTLRTRRLLTWRRRPQR